MLLTAVPGSGAPIASVPPASAPPAPDPKAPAQPAQPAPHPDAALRQQFVDLDTDLTAADATLTSMVAGRRTVGDGWGPYMASLAERFQTARDGFLTARTAAAGELGAKLGLDVLKLAEAAGSLSILARQRATLADGWASFLDTAIADARTAAELLAGPVKPPADKPAPPAEQPTPPAGQPEPPAAQPAPPAAPALPPALLEDVREAIGLVSRSIETIRTVPTSDRGDAATKDARIAAYRLNMEAQQQLEPHFDGQPAGVASELRRADAHLEDANWQLAKKPSPDGRFNGVDVPGALRDSQAALDLLSRLAG